MVFVEAFALVLMQVTQQPEGEEGEAKNADLDSHASLPGEVDHGVWQAEHTHSHHAIDAVEKCMHL